MLLQLIGIIVATIGWFYWKFNQRKAYWKNLGVPGPEASFPLGNFTAFFTRNRAETDLEWSQKYGKIYVYHTPDRSILMVTDPQLIKQITIKDFPQLMNRQKLNVYHELWNENMLLAESEAWKALRTITSPTFTSNKLRGMHKLMKSCVDKLVVYLDSVAAKSGVIQDAKGVMAGFSIDVISSTTFGIETDANGDRSGPENAIITHGRNFFNVKVLKAIISLSLPRPILNLLGIKTFFSAESFDFFENLVREVLKKRKENGIVRNDLIQMLLDSEVDEGVLKETKYENLIADGEKDINLAKSAKSTSVKRTLTDSQIVGTCILFFTGGYETTASTIFHILYLLAKNPEFQERLYGDVKAAVAGLDENSEECFEKILNNIPLLEATIKETLRLFPPISIIFRRVGVEGYRLGDLTLPKDLDIEMSNYAVHHNPEYYPDPERFNPDRFLPENAASLKPYTYLPFGSGPRNCLGMRFAYHEIKLCLVSLLLRYTFHRTAGTPDKPKFASGSPLLVTESFPIGIAKRV